MPTMYSGDGNNTACSMFKYVHTFPEGLRYVGIAKHQNAVHVT
jgi:hypothetical protein